MHRGGAGRDEGGEANFKSKCITHPEIWMEVGRKKLSTFSYCHLIGHQIKLLITCSCDINP